MRQKYYSINKVKKLNCEYNIVLGERSNGKSYAIKHECAAAAIKNPAKNKFIYLRRWDLELKSGLIEQYFADLNVTALTDNNSDCICVYNKTIYLAKLDEKTNKPVKQTVIGYARALSQDEHYKSGNYTDCSNIIYEEFISNQSYLPREPQRLQQFVSTIARRNRIQVWLVGNTISRVCPYFTEWELRNIPRQQQGTIDIYEHKTDQLNDNGEPITIKIAVEYAENSGNNSKMFFGHSAKAITGGAWQSEEKPHLPKSKDTSYSVMHTLILEWAGFKFLCEFLIDNDTGAVLWYVQPKTTAIQPNTRVITDRTIANSLYTRGFVALSGNENIAFKYINQGVIFFSDNLTGADFDACLRQILTIAKK